MPTRRDFIQLSASGLTAIAGTTVVRGGSTWQAARVGFILCKSTSSRRTGCKAILWLYS